MSNVENAFWKQQDFSDIISRLMLQDNSSLLVNLMEPGYLSQQNLLKVALVSFPVLVNVCSECVLMLDKFFCSRTPQVKLMQMPIRADN